MGASASKRLSETLEKSPKFNAACNSTYADSISLTQHAFPGVKPYQLVSATEHLHNALLSSLPIISRWLPLPPHRNQVDRAFKAVVVSMDDENDDDQRLLDEVQFKAFAVQVFVDAIIEAARKDLLTRLPIGVVGIAGLGMLVKPARGVLAAAIGAYALGFATNIYLAF